MGVLRGFKGLMHLPRTEAPRYEKHILPKFKNLTNLLPCDIVVFGTVGILLAQKPKRQREARQPSA